MKEQFIFPEQLTHKILNKGNNQGEQKAYQDSLLTLKKRIEDFNSILKASPDRDLLEKGQPLEKQKEEARTSANAEWDLLNFVISQLNSNVKFKGLSLVSEGSGEYNPDTKTFKLPVASGKDNKAVNPLLPLLHEGIHFLDDAHMRIYQKDAIDWLSQYWGDTPISETNAHWYEALRAIIPSTQFQGKAYQWGEDKVDIPKKITAKSSNQDYIKYYTHYLTDGEKSMDKVTYRDAQYNLGTLREEGKLTDEFDIYYFAPFSEISAFGIETLGKQWHINVEAAEFYKAKDIRNKENAKNLGREFLEKVLKSIYKNFQELHNKQQEPLLLEDKNQCKTFAEVYLNANKAFLDRLKQLRDYALYPDDEHGKNSFVEGLMAETDPNFQLSTFSSSSSSSGSSNQNLLSPMMGGNAPSNQNITSSFQGSYGYPNYLGFARSSSPEPEFVGYANGRTPRRFNDTDHITQLLPAESW